MFFIYIYIIGVHRCHGSVRTSVRGSRFDTISVKQGKKVIYYAQFLLIYFEQTLVQIAFFPPRCEYTKSYYIVIYILYIYI